MNHQGFSYSQGGRRGSFQIEKGLLLTDIEGTISEHGLNARERKKGGMRENVLTPKERVDFRVEKK